MTDLRTAAQQALEALEYMCNNTASKQGYKAEIVSDALENLKFALEQQEPMCVGCEGKPTPQNSPCAVCGKIAQPEQEPVAFIHRQGNHWEVSERHLDEDERDRGWTEEPLYTAPPKRKPLTEEEIMRAFYGHRLSVVEIARAVERAHGIGGQDER